MRKRTVSDDSFEPSSSPITKDNLLEDEFRINLSVPLLHDGPLNQNIDIASP